VGGPHLLSELNVVVPPELEKAATAWASAGQTVLYVVVDGRVIGTVALEDEIRPESAEAVKELHDLGVRVAMITGDSRQSRILLRSGSELTRSQLKWCPPTRPRRLHGSRPGVREWRWSAMV
jgi:haloacid dehalogenase-like hydrolase